ncbi:hypothetical protein UFOVP354_16 [uncultured Caudovirales phage]|uniref:Uncharacterized protein n=1 Tax=uncultured Caudovirales phage TaxID=2100421 RepID=A0A6J5LYQ4_9CAUD|nr:hypothetical protein UFOVP354_16 [uncultured Caudovirales phage]
MKFQKGNKAAKGRPVGIPNKNTTYVRDMVKLFLEDNVDKIHQWLGDVAAKDPAEALKILQGFLEYHVPKLQRTEQTGVDGGPVQHSIKVTFD